MPKQLSPERKREFEDLKAFLDFYMTHVEGIDPANPIHPINVLNRSIKEINASTALEGLKQAVNDTVEDLYHQPPEYILALDTALRERGIITFSEIRRRYSASYKRILKRGRIKNETEYYILAGIIADTEYISNEEERNLVLDIVMQYEKNI